MFVYIRTLASVGTTLFFCLTQHMYFGEKAISLSVTSVERVFVCFLRSHFVSHENALSLVVMQSI